MPNWKRHRKLLHKDSERVLAGLFAEAGKRGDTIAAVGYVFEFGRGQVTFDICANTSRHAEMTPARYRWNSGNYDRPAGTQDAFGGWSPEWQEELSDLDALVEENEGESEAVHLEIADICCEVLADLAKRGTFGDWSKIDFNVASLLDGMTLIEARDEYIRKLIAARA